MKNASELFVEALVNEGVERVYGVPGEENLDFLEALRTSPIELILTRHEQGAAFMAATYGRLTGKTGVCLSTLGPGATNFVTAAAYAQLGGFPLLMITGQKPIKQSKQGQFQIIDVVSMMSPITKYAKQIPDVHMIPSVVREAFRLAEEERPGAVHIEFPEDIAEETFSESENIQVIPKSTKSLPVASFKIIKQAASMIKDARFPLLLIGAGANRKTIRKALSHFVEQSGIYFFNTQMGKGCVDENSRQFLGTAALSENDYIHCAIDRADLILNVGHDVVEKPPFFMHHGGKKVIHMNFNSAKVDEVYFPQLEVIGDLSENISILTEVVGQLKGDYSYFARVKSAFDEKTTTLAQYPDFPVKPQRFVGVIRKIMPDDGIIALDNGIYKLWFARNYKAAQPNTILLDNALATMGAGLPSAMEAARLYPNRRVMAICGDGGFMMNSQEMETAIRLKLNLVILIINDNAYGMIRWKQYAKGMPDYGLKFNNPNFVLYAQSYGAKGHQIESTESFIPVVNQCFKEGGVQLVELPADYSENTKVLVDELKNKVCII